MALLGLASALNGKHFQVGLFLSCLYTGIVPSSWLSGSWWLTTLHSLEEGTKGQAVHKIISEMSETI